MAVGIYSHAASLGFIPDRRMGREWAAALRSMADEGVAPKDYDRFAWLVNHVVGQKEGEWVVAHELLKSVLAGSAEAGALCQRAVAALFAGEPLTAWALVARFAAAAEVPPAVARAAVQLAVIQFSSDATPVLELAAPFLDVVDELRGLHGQFVRVAPMLAGVLNNITSRLMDDERGSVDEATYRRALTDGADVCRQLWRVAGNWTNWERADYLVARCANRLNDFETAKQAAQSGLRTIEDNGAEDVDRAFLLIELGRAWRGLGEQKQCGQARALAFQLAQEFDSDLRDWFDSRARV